MILPLVWVVMPTTGARAAYLNRALRNWQRQTYPNFRVLVLDTSDSADRLRASPDVRMLMPYDDPRFLYAAVPPMPLGEKYNAGCHMAPDGALLAFSGDDDWNHPERLAQTVAAMEAAGVDIAGSMSIHAYRERDASAFLYQHPRVAEVVAATAEEVTADFTTPYMVHGTMLVAKHHWERCQMPSLQRASDSLWTREMLALGTPEGEAMNVEAQLRNDAAIVTVRRDDRSIRFLQMNAPHMYAAWVHGSNTGNSLNEHAGPFWHPLERPALVELLGPDAAAFGLEETAT